MTYEDQKDAVSSAVKQFPAEFGLRAYPGEVFRVSATNSYYSDHEHAVMVYTDIKRGDRWMDFAKGTVAELRREVVAVDNVNSSEDVWSDRCGS
jgi:hypothetical protein